MRSSSKSANTIGRAAALMREYEEHRGLPYTLCLVLRSDLLVGAPILLHAFGIQPDRIIRASRGQAYHVARATVLQLPPGNCPHAAVYPHGVLRRSWAKLRVGLPHTDEHDRVVCLRRPCPMRRCVVNEARWSHSLQCHMVTWVTRVRG